MKALISKTADNLKTTIKANRPQSILIAVEFVLLIVLSIVGFWTHRVDGMVLWSRLPALIFPLIFSWYLVAGFSGEYCLCRLKSLRHLWRIAMVAILATLLMSLLRAGWLTDGSISAIFLVIFMSLMVVTMVVVRVAAYLLLARDGGNAVTTDGTDGGNATTVD